MDFFPGNPTKVNTCCVFNRYENINLSRANPFDPRIYRQPNQWCKNELILRDPKMRC